MKKVIYYITPFVMFPVVLLLCNYIRYHITYTTVIIITIFLSLMMGLLSPTRHKFDYLMTVIMPFAMICVFFVIGFLDNSEFNARFDWHRGFKTATQPLLLVDCCCIAISTFLSSYQKFRTGLRKALKGNRVPGKDQL